MLRAFILNDCDRNSHDVSDRLKRALILIAVWCVRGWEFESTIHFVFKAVYHQDIF